VLNSSGHVVETISGVAITGPWDLTAVDEGNHTVLFVTSVLNGTVMANRHSVDGGTVVRIVLRTDGSNVPTVTSERTIASALSPTSDPNALIIGPTGVGLGADGVLDVADTLGSRIAAIPNALNRNSVLRNGGPTVTSGGDLMGPLGLVIAPGGDIVTPTEAMATSSRQRRTAIRLQPRRSWQREPETRSGWPSHQMTTVWSS